MIEGMAFQASDAAQSTPLAYSRELQERWATIANHHVAKGVCLKLSKLLANIELLNWIDPHLLKKRRPIQPELF